MRTATTRKTISARSNNARYRKEEKLKEFITPAYQPGDMDVLERYAERPMPTAFEQIDLNYKTMHSIWGWPSAIV